MAYDRVGRAGYDFATDVEIPTLRSTYCGVGPSAATCGQ
jgi:hypothetical protein